VPAGQSEGGRWAGGDGSGALVQVGARGRTSVSVNIRGRPLEASPAQVTRLALAQVRAREATQQVRDLDPSWRPRPSISDPNSVEGAIRREEYEALQAEGRLMELARSGLGGNNGPPLDSGAPRFGTGTALPAPFEAIGAYRTLTGMPDLASTIAGRTSDGTVAFGEVNGRPVFGVNSNAPGYTVADQSAAEAMRAQLVDRYPDVMATTNVGQIPNNAIFHAEANALLRAAEANGGSLAGADLRLQIDRELCRSCETVLPKISEQLGNPTVRIIDGRGDMWVMVNGIWIEAGRR
jgi:hypothetical protein